MATIINHEVVLHEDSEYGDLFYHCEQNEFYVLVGNPVEVETMCGHFFEEDEGVFIRLTVDLV